MNYSGDITQILAGFEDKAEALLRAWAGGAAPADTPASYVLARLLCRARVLRTKESNMIQGRRLLVFEAVRSHQLFSVLDQNLGNEELEALQRELLAQIRGEPLPPPLPATARRENPTVSATSDTRSTWTASAAETQIPATPTSPASRAPRPRRPAGEESKPLLQAATRSLYRVNAFRVTGLPVDASARDIARHADKLRMLEELGDGGSAHAAVFALQPPPTLDQIRDAIQKLKDPEQRVLNEFFWFWPEEFGHGTGDPALQALAAGDRDTAKRIWSGQETSPQDGTVALHNLAVLWHLTALEQEHRLAGLPLDAEARQGLEASWRNAFAHWDALASREAFWEKVGGRVRQLDDPRLTTGFVSRLRVTLPSALDKINGELALAYAEQGNLEMATLHVRLMHESNQGSEDVEHTAELVLTPARKRLQEQIRRGKQRATANPKDGVAAARELLEHARRAVVLFDLFFGKTSEARREMFDEVAAAGAELAGAYRGATRDDGSCLEILRAALNIASGIELRRRLQQNMDALTGNLKLKELEPLYSALQAIEQSKDAPSLRLRRVRREVIPSLGRVQPNDDLKDAIGIVLAGIAAAAWNVERDRGTALAAIELALCYARRADLKKQLEDNRSTLAGLAPHKLGQQQPPIPPRRWDQSHAPPTVEIPKTQRIGSGWRGWSHAPSTVVVPKTGVWLLLICLLLALLAFHSCTASRTIGSSGSHRPEIEPARSVRADTGPKVPSPFTPTLGQASRLFLHYYLPLWPSNFLSFVVAKRVSLQRIFVAVQPRRLDSANPLELREGVSAQMQPRICVGNL